MVQTDSTPLRGAAQTRVAFQGAPGAYSEEAVHRACGTAARGEAYRENREVARAVADGSVDLGLLPIENTLAGSVQASYDAILAEPTIHAVGEVVLPIHHCLLGVPAATLEDLRVAESHPVALAQCAIFFERHPAIEPRAVYDTAGAAEAIGAAGDVTRGAIASRAAAARYELTVLAADIEDRPDNQTRFLVLSRAPAALSQNTRVRTLLVLEAANRPGSLLELLTPLARHGLNLVKLESRPTGEPWTYRFLLEFEHRAGEPAAAAALADIAARAHTFRNVGTYAADSATGAASSTQR